MATQLTARPTPRIPLAKIDHKALIAAHDAARPAGSPAWHELSSVEQRARTAWFVRRATRGVR